MIHEVKGDILLSHAQVIAHAIAPHEHFDQGLALSLGEQWPALVKDYSHFYHAMQPKSGDTWVWSGAMSKHIINLLVNEPSVGKGEKRGRAKPEDVDRALRKLRREQDPISPFVFTTERGGPFSVSAFQRLIGRAGEAAGLGFAVHPHMLRHACGYALANKGVDTRTLQAYLGHKAIQHTVRYTELAPGRFKDFWR